MLHYLFLGVACTLLMACNSSPYIGQWRGETDTSVIILTLNNHDYEWVESSSVSYQEQGRFLWKKDSMWLAPFKLWDERHHQWILLSRPKIRAYRVSSTPYTITCLTPNDTLFLKKQEKLKK
ncbi:MAG: hypothetical protein IAE67_10600 [Candidatus Competibacteraceae bacterium]|nr:hypothetical protein [Candidatus Competibacteraceae bacterium]